MGPMNSDHSKRLRQHNCYFLLNVYKHNLFSQTIELKWTETGARQRPTAKGNTSGTRDSGDTAIKSVLSTVSHL